MKYLLIPLFIAVSVLNITCTTLKRYDSIKNPGTDNTLADVDLFGYRLTKAEPENGNKTLWDLSADAQSQFIKILNVRYPDNENFLNALSLEYLKEDPSMKTEDYVNKDLRMIFSVSKTHAYSGPVNSSGFEPSPADRIEYLKVSLKIPGNPGLKFKRWNMFTTEYGSIDIAGVSFTRSLEANASGFLSTDRKVSAGGKSALTTKEDQDIRYSYLKLNGKINSHSIEMEEEGTREADLTGNITADVSLEFEHFPEILTEISGLRDSTGRFNAPENLTLLQTDAVVPRMDNINDTIYAELKMDYVLRNVLRGQKTYPEWDDRVRYYTGSVSKTVALFTSADYVPDFYCIGNYDSNKGREIVRIAGQGSSEYSLIFRTRSQAGAFFEWLADYSGRTRNKGRAVSINGHKLKFMDDDLTGDIFYTYPGLKIIPCYHR